MRVLRGGETRRIIRSMAARHTRVRYPGRLEADRQQDNGVTAQNPIDTPPRLQYISQDIVGIKLEPIVALSSLRQVGVERLIRLPAVPLNIEIVDLASFLALSLVQKQHVVQNLRQLSKQGHAIWLDDVDDVTVQSFLCCRLPLSGIKIDKEAFWRLRDTPALRQLVSLCFQLAGKVLIEGIETERDRTWALQAGADLGQGYYWPSWTWPED
ncbi:hypothetical protein L1887_43912 [Cichorium endivia]|nr:hypothetical protein L1887_43912 [Cichorium endivia]